MSVLATWPAGPLLQSLNYATHVHVGGRRTITIQITNRLSSQWEIRQSAVAMSQLLKVEMSDDVVLALQKDHKSLAQELRLAASVKWY